VAKRLGGLIGGAIFFCRTAGPCGHKERRQRLQPPDRHGHPASTGQMRSRHRLKHFMLVGELGLDGGLRPVRGALPIAIAAREAGLAGLILPDENVAEAAVVEGAEVRGARTLLQVVRFLEGEGQLPPATIDHEALFRTASTYYTTSRT